MATATLPELLPHTRDGEQKTKNLAEYYSRMGSFLDSSYEEGSALQKDIPELKQVQDGIDYLVGIQWKESMPSYRAKPVSNEILQMFWETIGLLTDVKPFFNVTAIGSASKFSKTQEVLNKLAKGWAGSSKFEFNLAKATMYGMLTTAPAKIYWNPSAKGYSGDPSDGEQVFEPMPANALIRLGAGEDLQDDEMVIYRRTRTLEWIKRQFPLMGVMVKPEEARSKYTVDSQAPVTVMPTFFQSMSPAARRMMGVSDKDMTQSVFPKAEVREFWMKDSTVNESSNQVWMGPEGQAWGYWVKPGQKLYPRGRLMIRANGVTLYDEPNPYYHRKFPFALLGLYSVPWQMYALSVIGPWMKQQDILNQIMSGLLQNVKKAVNPPLLAPKAAIHPEALRAIDSSKPNLKISWNSNAGTPPTWGQPPNLPGYVLQAYGIVKSSMQQASGSAAMSGATDKKQVPGSDTLDRISFSKNTPIRMMGRNLEGFVDEIGGMWTANALQFYDATTRIELLGEDGLVKEDMDDRPGSLIPDGINSESYVRRFKFKCDKGTLLNVQRQDKIQIGFALRKNHDISRNQLFDLLDWNIDREKNQQELADEQAAVAKAMQAAGVQPGKHK
jgi:hypothetical protein